MSIESLCNKTPIFSKKTDKFHIPPPETKNAAKGDASIIVSIYNLSKFAC